MSSDHFDVLVIGAGLSGIGAGYYLQRNFPDKSYAILEAREDLGGTWDLFRYPGVRSDSDMFTLGYSFRPWRDAAAIADGPAILSYIRETAAEYGIDEHIRFGHRVCRAEWSSAESRWTVLAERGPENELVRLTCDFLYMCTGYYDYDRGYLPEWPSLEQFAGQVVHPQHWPEDLDYGGKRVLIIGSGATAVTLVPAMAEEAGHVTMLQRSPTYIATMPTQDAVADWLRAKLPERVAHDIIRWKNALRGIAYYSVMRWRPEMMKRVLVEQVQEELGEDYDVDTHFTPRYNPWDERLCLAPDGDFFEAIRSGAASVVTDRIERFTPTGVRLQSDREVEADIIITATGLVMKPTGGIETVVDGEPVKLPETMTYKGMMLSDVPNMAMAIGYTNASWTLKCELAHRYVCRLLAYMDEHGYVQCVPRRDAGVEEEPLIDFTSGYVQRALHTLPSQGSQRPWKLYQNYLLDWLTFRFGKVDDGTMEFRGREQVAADRGRTLAASEAGEAARPESST
ncbi:MAG: NAD(P)/FAD-dependent oxidoreductase [Candidatus Promineifilaceae bacterium]|nr:NAD(P)/FAD-dependent oxidoreductase [Candidatus Promineifilaceae bacterium]